jgi:eukaryotic-like serine/threonine-protein kinase
MAEASDGPLNQPGVTLVPGNVLAYTYEIRRLINSGGMGRVYEAENRVTGDTVAVKVIRPELLGDERLRAMFVREAAVLRRIRDEAIVGYEGMFQDEQGCGFLVMNFIDGPSLAERMSRQKLTEVEAEALLRRLAAGLETAHAAGICHRDLSPDNVLLPGGNLAQATLIDFGIAKLVDPEAGTLVGTDIAGKAGYMSPEQLGVVDAEIGPPSDIYSLALVIAAAVRGAPVDMGTRFADIVEARRRVPPLNGVPIRLRDRLTAMLAPEPTDRPVSMAELIESLGRGGAAKPAARAANPLVGNDGAGRTARSRMRPGRWALVAVAAALVLAVAGVGYLFLAPPPVLELIATPVLEPPAAPERAGEGPDAALATLSASPPDLATGDGEADALLLARIQGLLETTFPCAEIVPSLGDNGRVRLAGSVAQPGDEILLERALADLLGIQGFKLAVEARADYPCAVADFANRAMPPAAERLSLNNPDHVYREGDFLIVKVQAAPDREAHVYLDYFDAEGNVVHLRPNPLAESTRLAAGATARHGVPPEEQQPGVRSYQVAPPFGRNLLLLMAADTPIFSRQRPELEPAGDYLRALEALVSERPGAIRAGTVELEISP